ncbi:bleomycin resistance protein [Mucilaginibacter sp. PAMC 26640]|nr:bleomycin resistance protein [Mucilaginibacter sp. PAMC 26640]
MKVQIFDHLVESPGAGGVAFAPMLYIPSGITDVSFYENAFDARELRRFINEDGTIHVSELIIGNAIFHLHEPTNNTSASNPAAMGYTTVVIGLFVDDVHAIVTQAEAAGARIVSPVEDYDYGYRQGEVIDPFGHRWQIQKAIAQKPDLQ